MKGMWFKNLVYIFKRRLKCLCVKKIVGLLQSDCAFRSRKVKKTWHPLLIFLLLYLLQYFKLKITKIFSLKTTNQDFLGGAKVLFMSESS